MGVTPPKNRSRRRASVGSGRVDVGGAGPRLHGVAGPRGTYEGAQRVPVQAAGSVQGANGGTLLHTSAGVSSVSNTQRSSPGLSGVVLVTNAPNAPERNTTA